MHEKSEEECYLSQVFSRKVVFFFFSLAIYASFLFKIKQDIFPCLIVTCLMWLNQELHEIQDI